MIDARMHAGRTVFAVDEVAVSSMFNWKLRSNLVCGRVSGLGSVVGPCD